MTAVASPQAAAVRGRPVGFWGVIMLSITEGILFALLLFTYFYLWGRSAEWPQGGIEPPELLISGIRSVLLFASSATMHWADVGARKGRNGQLQAGLLATFVLAAIFMVGHVEELFTIYEEFAWYTNAYGSVYWTVVNFHALHLLVGMMMIVFAFLAARRGVFTAERHLPVQVVSIYWHFVDAIWVVVYSSLYLAPNLLGSG